MWSSVPSHLEINYFYLLVSKAFLFEFLVADWLPSDCWCLWKLHSKVQRFSSSMEAKLHVICQGLGDVSEDYY